MRPSVPVLALVAALGAPRGAWAQHSPAGGDTNDPMPRHAGQKSPAAPAPQRGVLPIGAARQIEVLVLSYGFSPAEIHAEQGEAVVLYLRRSDDVHCKDGLEIPARKVVVQLPVDETVPVPLKLDRAETLVVACRNEDVQASIVVAPR